MERSGQPLAIEPVTPETAGIAFELLYEFVVSIGREAEFLTSEADFRRNLFKDSPPFEFVIARYQGEVAGYASFRLHYDTWAGRDSMHVSGLYVRPAFRARHVAAALYLYLAGLARRRGYHAILGLVSRSNDALLGVYRTAGAEFTDYVMCELKLDQISDELLNIGASRASASGSTA
jgi:ribosomal protein S18 acetylase RimI-like enzyme